MSYKTTIQQATTAGTWEAISRDELIEAVEEMEDEIRRLQESDDALTRVWQALGITSYTGRSVWEHVAELRAAVSGGKT